MATAHTIAATTHGRYLLERVAERQPAGLLVGFHGYAESAEAQLDRLRSVPESRDWLLVSIQGLHRFYTRRSQDVVASWMTSQDRGLAIADNLDYVSAVIETMTRESPTISPIVLAGFSQGVAMAFRAACASGRDISGVVSVGGDVPPELPAPGLARVKAALLARGAGDEWYTLEKLKTDEARLQEAGVRVHTLRFDGGHEWNEAVSEAVGSFLTQLTVSRR